MMSLEWKNKKDRQTIVCLYILTSLLLGSITALVVGFMVGDLRIIILGFGGTLIFGFLTFLAVGLVSGGYREGYG